MSPVTSAGDHPSIPLSDNAARSAQEYDPKAPRHSSRRGTVPAASASSPSRHEGQERQAALASEAFLVGTPKSGKPGRNWEVFQTLRSDLRGFPFQNVGQPPPCAAGGQSDRFRKLGVNFHEPPRPRAVIAVACGEVFVGGEDVLHCVSFYCRKWQGLPIGLGILCRQNRQEKKWVLTEF